MSKQYPFKLIINEQGQPENRWITDPSKYPDIVIVGEARKDKDGNWERAEWMDVLADNSININPYRKKEILEAEAAAQVIERAAKSESNSEAEPIDDQIKEQSQERLRKVNLATMKSMTDLKDVIGDILITLDLK